MSRLDEIEARIKAATPGPWRASLEEVSRRAPPWCLVDAGATGPVICRTGRTDMPRAQIDASLIAHAPADLAALVRVARAAQKIDSGKGVATAMRELRAALAALESEATQ